MKGNILIFIIGLIFCFIVVGIIMSGTNFISSKESNYTNVYNNNEILSESNSINQENSIQDNYEQLDILEKINSADKVKVEEEFISLNKKYNIYIGNSYIGNISGKFINVTGDVFTLKDKNSNVISSEKQIKRWGIKLNRMAELRNKSGNTVRLYWRKCNKRFFLY